MNQRAALRRDEGTKMKASIATTKPRTLRTPARARCEDPPAYVAGAAAAEELRPPCVAEALAWLESRFHRGPALDSPAAVRDWLRLRYGAHPVEVFGAMFLDAQHRLIECRELFHGTLTQTAIYPREVLRQVLELNASALVLFHNHPSGLPEPSRSDEFLTQSLKSALALVDVRVIDHFVVGASGSVSFAERGLL